LKGSGGLATLGRGESGGGTGEEGGDSELHLGVVVLKKRVSDKSCKRWCGAGFFGQSAMLLSHERGVESSPLLQQAIPNDGSGSIMHQDRRVTKRFDWLVKDTSTLRINVILDNIQS
jgi:hypothetical protein